MTLATASHRYRQISFLKNKDAEQKGPEVKMTGEAYLLEMQARDSFPALSTATDKLLSLSKSQPFHLSNGEGSSLFLW